MSAFNQPFGLPPPGVRFAVGIKLDVEEMATLLSPEQIEALMAGIAKVVNQCP